jgi:predicted acetyltransferase
MGRVTDVLGAFSAMSVSPEVAGSLTIGISDPVCEWNNDCFHIKAGDGRVLASRTTEEPDITMSIQTLAQVYWGCPSLERTRWAGQLSVSNEKSYELLSKILPPAISFITDGF